MYSALTCSLQELLDSHDNSLMYILLPHAIPLYLSVPKVASLFAVDQSTKGTVFRQRKDAVVRT